MGALCASLLMACSEKNASVERISNQNYEVVSDSIYTRMPGAILYQEGVVFWDDPMSFENFIHAVDVEKKTELVAFANKGEGPNDFTATDISLDADGGVVVYDLNKPLKIHYRIADDKSNVYFEADKYEIASQATRLLCLDKDKTLSLCPEAEKMFQIKENDNVFSFGERPIKEDVNNAYDIFQGQVAYNPQRRMLVYSNLVFPYLSVYKCSANQDWSLVKELKEDWDYTISEGKLHFASVGKKCAMELALTEDYIVLLQRDTEVEESISKQEMRGRNVASLPRSLFVYDYDINTDQYIINENKFTKFNILYEIFYYYNDRYNYSLDSIEFDDNDKSIIIIKLRDGNNFNITDFKIMKLTYNQLNIKMGKNPANINQ